MKSLTQYISESEIRQDYDKINDLPSIDNKQAIMEKYGIQSKKTIDIKISLLDFLRENRNNKSEFTDEDIKYFLRQTNGFPTIYKKVNEMLSKESNEFVLYLFDKYKKQVQNRKLENAKSTDKNLGVQDKFTLKCFENIEKYVNEHLNTE